jgi:hypothetical protein
LQSSRLKSFWAGLAIVCVFFGLTGFVEAHPSNPNEYVANVWDEKIDKIHDLLLASQWKSAERKARKLSEEMIDLLYSGPGGKVILGRVCFLRAIALEGMGEKRLADWYWRISVQLFPSVEQIDVNRYLPDSQLGAAEVEYPGMDLEFPAQDVVSELASAGRFTAPERIGGEDPRYPHAKIGGDNQITLTVLVATDGQVYFPEITEMKGEYTLALSALEAMAGWTFEPSKIDGEPIPVHYRLSFRFITK